MKRIQVRRKCCGKCARIESPGHFIRRGDGIGRSAQDGSARWVNALDDRASAFTFRGAMFVQEQICKKADRGAAQGSRQGALGEESPKVTEYGYAAAETALLRAVRERSRYEWKAAGDYLCGLDHAEILAVLDRAIALAEATDGAAQGTRLGALGGSDTVVIP